METRKTLRAKGKNLGAKRKNLGVERKNLEPKHLGPKGEKALGPSEKALGPSENQPNCEARGALGPTPVSLAQPRLLLLSFKPCSPPLVSGKSSALDPRPLAQSSGKRLNNHYIYQDINQPSDILGYLSTLGLGI